LTSAATEIVLEGEIFLMLREGEVLGTFTDTKQQMPA
jgi:hypothetical protein